MKTLFDTRRWVTGLLLAAFAVAALSPVARADGRWRRYKGYPGTIHGPVVRHYAPRRVVYYQRHSDAAPLFAGLIGGLVIGSALAHAGDRACESAPAYTYWDPWCHERFASLAIYRSHLAYHHHPRFVRVISIESGDCVGAYGWRDGGWCEAPGDGRYDDRDWDD
ncbi:MAG TPA: hypothetical protein VGK89_05465 [Candidatus Eisenbacteria bacterium]|jgi:hypothetical protein